MTERPAPEQPPESAGVTAHAPVSAGDEASATRGFLFADLRDYTGHVDIHGDRAGAALLARYRVLVRQVVAAARGAEIRTEGDSFYVVFGSVSAAVRAGLAIVEAAAATATDTAPIRVGVGVHAGETVETADGFVGSAVNIAARLCAQARAGEVVVSETVRGLVRTSLEVDFVPLGARRLKGVAEPVTCYRVMARGVVNAARGRAVPAVPRRRWLLAASLGIFVLLAVAGAVVLGAGRGGAPMPSPGSSGAAFATTPASASPGASTGGPPSASWAPTASPSPGPFPTSVEAAILAALPADLAQSCVRGATPDDARLAGFSGIDYTNPPHSITPSSEGGVTCRPGSGAARVYVMAPAPPAGTQGADPTTPGDAYLGYLAGLRGLAYGSCASGQSAHGRWSGPRGSGQVACLASYDGRPWIYFTFAGGRYLAFATRDDTDYGALYRWWDQLLTFLP